MIPCDVEAMAQAFPSLRGSLALTVLAAWLKEPAAVQPLAASAQSLCAEQQGELSPDCVFEMLIIALRCVSDETDRTAQQQINKQGVARWMGALSASRVLGVIGDTPGSVGLSAAAGSSHVELKLSSQAKAKPVYAPSACTVNLRKFVETCNSQQKTFRDMLQTTSYTADGVLVFPARCSAILTLVKGGARTRWKTYAMQNMTRRLLIA
jgi:hypothetical protein